ncbi:MAG: dTMP kinase, partial [Candidatus Aenigmatarchaeota archaeon]
MFIVFEGIDGSGQSTHSKLLAEYLESKGYKVFLTKEPTQSEIGKLTRRILKGEVEFDNLGLQLLMMADRAYHLKEIKRYLKEGYFVISDRFWFSTVVYGAENEEKFEILYEFNSKLFGFPDVIIYLDLDPEISLKRIENRAKEIFENLENLKKVRENYLKLIKKIENKCKVYIIDSSRSIEEVQK